MCAVMSKLLTRSARCLCRWLAWQCHSHTGDHVRSGYSPSRPSMATMYSSQSSTSLPHPSAHTCTRRIHLIVPELVWGNHMQDEKPRSMRTTGLAEVMALWTLDITFTAGEGVL